MAEGGSVHRSVPRRSCFPTSSTSSLSSTSTIPCRFYQIGQCRFGESCRFLHITENVQLPNTKKEESVSIKDEWVNAPEFVPSFGNHSVSFQQVAIEAEQDDGSNRQPKSYARALDPNAGQMIQITQSTAELCPYYLWGNCRYAEDCTYIHGDCCETCGQFCLHPADAAQRQHHQEECLKVQAAAMEISSAEDRSKEKACGICMEVVWEKSPPKKQRFGLLPNCSHCFCLDCIRTWRGQDKQFENKIIRSCPECRVQSDFVCPSRYWCETREEKQKLIEDYKKALSNKDCKYFNQGRGECPFGNKCFYLHALADGTKKDVGPPLGKNPRRRRLLGGGGGGGSGDDTDDESDIVRFLLWDFLEERESRIYLQLGLDFDEIDYFTDSDADDSDDNSSIVYLH